MIEKMGQVPQTAGTHMLTRAAEKCGLAGKGYVEEEYFFSGTANVYGAAPNGPQVLFADAPYTNRLVVRRPANGAKASGRVLVEILNATSGMDIDRMWVFLREQIMRNGDVYVGMTSKPSSVAALKRFDKVRYAPLSWQNPRPQPVPKEVLDANANVGAIDEGTQTGLVWDMLTDLADGLRGGAVSFGGAPVKWVYLTGWSQSTGYMQRYIADFAYRNGRRGPFDGYFAGGGVRILLPALNQCEIPLAIGDEGVFMQKMTEPYILLQTESENHRHGNEQYKVEDSDRPEFLHRTYEIAGATHDDWHNMDAYYEKDEDNARAGITLAYAGKEAYPNNYPAQFVYRAAYQDLLRWAEQGVQPKRVPRIAVNDVTGENERDADGNALGGWRLPPLDVPVCTYHRFCTPATPGADALRLFGCVFPFKKEKLAERYGTLQAYREQVEENAHTAAEEGRLLPEDVPECIEFCIEQAARFGLE